MALRTSRRSAPLPPSTTRLIATTRMARCGVVSTGQERNASQLMNATTTSNASTANTTGAARPTTINSTIRAGIRNCGSRDR